MESRGVLIAADGTEDTQPNHPSRTHITAKGKQGKVLRKKLALALGLKVPSSGTPSTVDSEEEIEEYSSQNIVETFRKQTKTTTVQQTLSPDHTKKVVRQHSSVLLQKAANKLETSRDEPTENKEKLLIAHTRGSTLGKASTTRLEGNDHVTLKRSPDVTISNGNTRSEPQTEEIFSTLGEQTDSSFSTQASSSADSVKYLRDKIRKNARARKLPRPVTSQELDKETIDITKQRKQTEGSQIPVRVVNKKNQDVKTVENILHQSKIPRRKSQNGTANSKISTKKEHDISNLLTEVFSTNENESNIADKLKIDVRDTRENKENASNIDKSSLNVTHNEEKREVMETSQNTSSNSPANTAPSEYDLDAILLELERMKTSLCKTCDNFHEMNEFASELRKELKEIRKL